MFKVYYILTYPLTAICLFFILIYRKALTGAKSKCCHLLPTCSAYAWECFKSFGVIIGGYLTFKRLLRCGRSSHGGVDFPKLNIVGNYKWIC